MKDFRKIVLSLALAGCIFSFPSNKARAEKIIINHDISPGVNVRSEKSDDAPILGGIDYQDIYDVKSEDDYWIKINFEGKDSYVGKKWFFKLYDYKIINDCKLKKDLSKKSENLKSLKKDKDKVTILEICPNDMAKVIYKDSIGYVDIKNLDISQKKTEDKKRHIARINYINKNLNKYEDFGQIEQYNYDKGNFIKERKEEEEIQYTEQEITYDYYEVSGDGADIYWYACNFLGNPYVFGGNDLLRGIDCSGFTQQVYKEFGISLPRIAQDQYYVGEDINLGEENAGDLVFYGTSPSNISHVAIADGNGGIVHASSPKTGIIRSYIGNPIGIKRIIE
ncbi:MAG: C40 family peptidase [Peptoniphilaceae bacterium]|nr:C40 family peptidase [Peptoniphilaceae bacterium]MDY6018107.1 C40 family peptidase [Anaerococcus sp.]